MESIAATMAAIDHPGRCESLIEVVLRVGVPYHSTALRLSDGELRSTFDSVQTVHDSRANNAVRSCRVAPAAGLCRATAVQGKPL
jgi:hypothetical protein